MTSQHRSRLTIRLALLMMISLCFVTTDATAELIRVINNQGVGPTFGLDPANTYTHKLDFPGDGNSDPINGVQLSAVGAGPGVDPLTGNGFSFSAPNLGTFNPGDNAVIQDFHFNSGGGNAGDAEILTLSGLTPGEVYETRLYYRNFGSRPNTVTVDTGGGTPWVGTLDQATSDAQNYQSIVYRADGPTATLRFVQHGGTASWHQYAVTNQTAQAPSVGDTLNILGLFPTGVNSVGAPLANGAADPHYAFISGPQASLQAPQATVQSNHPAWDANDGGSKWIGVTGTGTTGVANNATYLYQMAFDLPFHADLASVLIGGDWWADDAGNPTSILLNGVDTLVPGTPVFNSANGTPFLVSDGMNGASFLHGTNTLSFSVRNGSTGANPHGLRVANLSGTYVTTIPEPSTFALAAIGLIGMAWFSRRQRRA